MSVTLTISDETFRKLTATARSKGKENVEQLLEEWPDAKNPSLKEELRRRRQLGERMRELREHVSREHGIMPDSTELIREDRNR